MTAGPSVEEGLALALQNTDIGRRVGWAKAFENARRVDSLEEQVRCLSDELNTLRRAYSRLIGFVENLPGPRTEPFNQELAAHAAAERSFRREDAWTEGRARADRHRQQMSGWTDNQLYAWKDRRAEPGPGRAERRRLRRDLAVSRGHDLVTLERSVCSCGEFSSPEFLDREAVHNWRQSHLDAVVPEVRAVGPKPSVQPEEGS